MAKQKYSSISKIFVAIVLILFVSVGYRVFINWQSGREIGNSDLPNTQLTSPSPLQEEGVVVLCPTKPILPKGYQYQSPLNSFFGLTLKDGQGKICEVVLGPNYNATHEGFSGEQIQINSYSIADVTPDQLMKEDGGIEISRLNDKLRYKRSSYGGDDQILIFKSHDSLIQLIWREAGSKNQIENIALDLATELQ